MRRVLALSVSLLLAACGQKIVVVECDGEVHSDQDGATSNDNDAGNGNPNDASMQNPTDGGAGQDASMNGGRDAGGGGNRDAGGGGGDAGSVSCAMAPYCIHDLTPGSAKANVREAVTFTPQIDNPQGMTLAFTVDKNETSLLRRQGLRAAVLSEIDVSATVDQNGVITFTVNDVPTWYATTTFTVTLHAKSASGPDVITTGSVDIRGNVLMSGSSSVFAVASDGRPAHSVNFTHGELISGSSFVESPKSLFLARDGTLVVFDEGATPPRIRHFDLTTENAQLPDFAILDSMNMPLIPDSNGAHGLSQLTDGRFILPCYVFGRSGGDSFILVFHEDGSFDRRHLASNPTVEWAAATASKTANEILIVETDSPGRLFRLNPDTGMELGNIATDFTGPRGLLALDSGNMYVGITGAVLRVTPQGGKTMVSNLMSATFDYWGYLATYADGKIIATRDTPSEYQNVVVIDGTMNLGWLRMMGVGASSIEPVGLVYLE